MILLNQPYFGLKADTITVLDKGAETNMVQSGKASFVNPDINKCTEGNLTTELSSGQAAIAVNESSVSIYTNACHSQSQANVWINQPTDDATLLYVRPYCQDGVLTVIGNEVATHIVNVSWAIVNSNYSLS